MELCQECKGFGLRRLAAKEGDGYELALCFQCEGTGEQPKQLTQKQKDAAKRLATLFHTYILPALTQAQRDELEGLFLRLVGER